MPKRVLPGPYEADWHTVEIGYTGGGMGTPGFYTVACTCSWRSTWEELWNPIDTPIENTGFARHFVDEVVDAGGLRHWNAAHPGQKMGGAEQALGEALKHLGVTVDQARNLAVERVHRRMEELRKLLNSGEGTDMEESVNRIVDAAATLKSAQAAAAYLAAVEPDPRAGMP